MKEKVCFVALDHKEALETAKNSNEHTEAYELPTGEIININTPRFMGPEALFDPELIEPGCGIEGIAVLANQSIEACDVDVRFVLRENIVVSGGTTLYRGLPERLEKDMDALAPKAGNVKITAPEDRYTSVWCGGSTLSSLATFEAQWITKDEYEESGKEIVHIKC
jgi:actin beta/gamma 1